MTHRLATDALARHRRVRLAGSCATGSRRGSRGDTGAHPGRRAGPGSRPGRGPWRRPPGTRRKRVLAWADTRNGQAQHESVAHALAIIERLGYESGMWDTLIRTDSHIIAKNPKKTDGTPASGGPSLSNVDAIFFAGHREIAARRLTEGGPPPVCAGRRAASWRRTPA